MKETIPGVIIIYSCHKHQNTRLKEFKLSKKEYVGWKVFNVIGNPFLEQEYKLDDNLLTIKCEDSYIHILKKVVLAIKIILEIYTIEQGILRCGDDIQFDENKLELFLTKNKEDYLGCVCYSSQLMKIGDNWMPNYYCSHQEDLQNPLHNIKYTLQEMMQFNERPACNYIHGVIVYLSLKACNILISHMDSINWNIFTKDEIYGYPYIIEDIGVAFIMMINKIIPTNYEIFSNYSHYSHPEIIGYHTNKYK